MNAYRIKNAIVAAEDEQSAIAAWAEHFNEKPESAGPVEDLPLAGTVISIEQEDGSYEDGTLLEVIPPPGSPACVICEGECDCS